MSDQKDETSVPAGRASNSSTDITSLSSTSSPDRSASPRPDAISRAATNMSLEGEHPVAPLASVVEIPDSFYDRLSPRRKVVIVAVLSYCSLLAPISSTTVLAALPEVAAEYATTGAAVGVSNALYMLFMGLSPLFWGPLSQVYGRRAVNLGAGALFFACSVGTALAPNLGAFFVFRVLTAFEGTAFILVGSAAIGDIYRPTERGTAMGWFLSGTLVGPAFGPVIGGIVVTYTSWRVIFWLQTALSGVAFLAALVLLPETIFRRRAEDLEGCSRREKARVLWRLVEPTRVLRLYVYPNLLLAGLASSALIWNMYSLLTPIRYVLNPRFGLATPLQGGLFYLAPGAGYLAGTFGGGRYADWMVKRWMARRDGVRIPEDRLRSALPFMGVAIPACVLVYGWGIEKDVGGMPLAAITLFLQGVAQLFCFPSLNTYCLDVMQGRGAEVIAGNYLVRYLFACMGTAVVIPAINGVGVGWFSTISAAFLVVAALGTAATVRWGARMREHTDRWRVGRRERKARRAARAMLGGERTRRKNRRVAEEVKQKEEV
jgi:multidrug resistance protein